MTPTAATPFESLVGFLGHRAGYSITVPASCELGDRTEVHVQVGQQLVRVDEPDLGRGETATPGHYALAALGSCEAITFRYWSDRLGIQIDELRVEVRGDLDMGGLIGLSDGARPRHNDVRMVVKVSGPEPIERYEELRRAVEEHSPVLDVFVNEVPVATALELFEAA